MATPIRLKRSAVAGRVPSVSDLQLGELALNFYDGKLYVKEKQGENERIVEIGANLNELVVTSGISTIGGLRLDINTLETTISDIRISQNAPNRINTLYGELVLDSHAGQVTVDDVLVVNDTSSFARTALFNESLDILDNFTVTGISTFTGIVDANSGAFITNVQIGISAPTTIDTSVGNLYLDSDGGTVIIQDFLNVTQNAVLDENLDVTGNLDVQGVTTLKEVRVGVGTSGSKIDTTLRDLTLDSAGGTINIDDQLLVTGIGTFKDNVFIEGSLDVQGISLFTGLVEIENQSTINNLKLGFESNTIDTKIGPLKLTSYNRFLEVDASIVGQRNLSIVGLSTFTGTADLNDGAYIDQIQIGITDDNEIDTTSGELTLDSAAGTVTIDDQLVVTGFTTFTNSAYVTDEFTAAVIQTGYGVSEHLKLQDGIITGPPEIIIDPYEHENISGKVIVRGDLYVEGTEFIVNSETIELKDFQVGIATDIGDNELLNGAGIGFGATTIRKTITWNDNSKSLYNSENIDIPESKSYKIGGEEKLSRFQLSIDNIESVGYTTVGFLTAYSTIFGHFDGKLNSHGNTWYVAENGINGAPNGDTSSYGTNINQPFRTIEYALSNAEAGDVIIVSAGDYEETCPLVVPSGVTLKGAGLRATTIRPTNATNTQDVFKLNNLSTIEDLTIKGSFYDSLNDTGYAFSYATGIGITNRSPYIQRVTVLNRGSVVTSDDPYGYDAADAGRGAKVDGSLVSGDSIEAGMLFNEVTFFTPNNRGIVLTNGARVEYLNCFHYFADEAIVGLAGTTGIAGTANARIKVVGLNTTPAADDVVKLYSSGVGIATGTVVSYESDFITISGLGIGTFSSVGAGTTQDIRIFASDGTTQVGTADTITFADYKMFGAEMRSVGCAFEYGNKGVVADGNGVQLRLFATNFNHIGSGKDFSNDDTLVNQLNEVVELNGGQVSYVSIDQKGDFRIGESFFVDQETGNVSFANTGNTQVLNAFEVLDQLPNPGAAATLTYNSLTLAELKFATNTIESTLGDLNIESESGTVNINEQLYVTGVSTFVGISTFLDKVVFDSTNSIQIPVGVTTQRDSSPVPGQIRYNTELSSFEGYGPGNAWGSLGGVKDVDQDTYIVPEISAGSDEDILYFYNNGINSATLSETHLQLNTDAQITGVVTATSFYGEGGALTLGGQYTPEDAPTDGDYVAGGALNTFTGNTKIVDSVDELNELAFNIIRNTAVTEVDFVSTPSVGGSPLNVSLNITHSGNANRYDVDWGDGTSSLNQSSSTIAHTYIEPNGAILPITVTARNSSGVGAGHSQTLIKSDYITVYTPDPIVDFDFYALSSGGSPLSFWDDGDTVYLENTTTNVTGFDVTYTISYGDATADTISSNAVPGGVGGGRTSHTFNNAVETDKVYTVTTVLNDHPAADPAVIPASDIQTFKVYSEHTPSVTGVTTIGINSTSNSGYPITLTNTTESTIGNYNTFGIQYRYNWGDGETTTVNVGSNSSGDTNRTISHTYDLTDNSAGISSTYTATLEVISNHTNSPFVSSEFEVLVEPEVRSIFSGIATVTSDRIGDNTLDVYSGTDLFGEDRSVAVFTNTSHNASDYVYNWGDGTSNTTVPDNVSAGGTLTQIYHSFQGSPGNKVVTLTANGQPGHIVQNGRTDTVTVQLNAVPAAPTAITDVTLSMNTSSQGTSPYLCADATRNESGVGIETGSSVIRYSTSTPINTNYLNDINGSHTGSLSAQLNGVGIGTQTFTTSTGESGSFGDLHILSEGDAHDEISSSTYPTGFYQCFTARITKALSEISVGVNDYGIVHSTLGSAGITTFVKDDLNTTPTLTSGTLTESSGGSKRYISGIPYYDSGGPTLTLTGVQVSNFTGQTYQNTSTPVDIAAGTRYESTSGDVISTKYYTYAQVDGSVTFIDSTYNVPKANTGVSSPYTFGTLSIPLTNSSIRTVQDLKIRAKNSSGTGTYTTNSTKVQVHTSSQYGISEVAIDVDNSLGNGTYTDDGIRIFDFNAATTNNPAINGAQNYYVSNVYTEASDPGVQGTKEATIRLGVLKHDTTNYATGFLPVGPDRSGDTGTQYFTFAFRRQVVANFDLNITSSSGVAGVWIAAPGTQVDTTSGLNGWLRADTPYAGSGVPGSGSGGNGSDGCAANSGDRILPSTALSGGYTMTLGSENMSNATGNVVLVRIALTSGQSITNLSVGVAN